MSKSNISTKKLKAIVFTDIVDFTKLSADDEQKALEVIDRQRELLKPIVLEHKGEWLKEIGDGLLFSFDSSLDAVRCSIKIQEALKDVEGFKIRIGIHQGDIFIKDGDVYGDDVNITSRIEPLSSEGGIAISDKIYRDITSNQEFKTSYVGKPELKGVSQEVKVYCIISHGLPRAEEIKDINLSISILIKQFFFSLKYLLAKPGFLSNQYVLGEREKYTSPAKIYLFTTILVLIILTKLTPDTTHYLKFYKGGFGFVMASKEDGSGIQSQFGVLKVKENIQNSKQLYRSIDAVPLKVNILSFIPKVFLFSFPLFALLLKIFYWNRLYVNHLILVFHNHSFYMIIISSILLINSLISISGKILMLVTMILLFSYTLLSAYNFYKQGKIMTLIKFLPLAVSYFFLFIISNVLVAKLFFLFPNIIN